MKQIIPFVKDISFNTKISEVTSIALEHNLQMENEDSVVGNFIVSGKYKINDISINEEVFEKNIPFDITLDDKYDASKVKIDIDNFFYEIINDEFLRVHIDVLAQNLVYIKEDKPVIEEIEKPELIVPEVIDTSLELEENKDERSDNMDVKTLALQEENDCDKEDMVKDITDSFLDQKDKYVTYKVHIVRENETVEDIIEKYNVNKEELEKYNDLNNIVIGNKIIVPAQNE